MRNKKREQLLIRIITLLDEARLGERQETILNLLHCARRASRDRDDFTAQDHSIKALGQLRKARHSLRVSGAAEQDITPLDSAIAMLLPVQEDANADLRASFIAESIEWRYLLLFLLLPAGLALILGVVHWFAGHLLSP